MSYIDEAGEELVNVYKVIDIYGKQVAGGSSTEDRYHQLFPKSILISTGY
jgi:hypothetical protein